MSAEQLPLFVRESVGTRDTNSAAFPHRGLRARATYHWREDTTLLVAAARGRDVLPKAPRPRRGVELLDLVAYVERHAQVS